jgi:hypothetical protein
VKRIVNGEKMNLGRIKTKRNARKEWNVRKEMEGMKRKYQPLSNKEQQEKTAEYFEGIVKGVKEILTHEKYREYLNFSAKLPRYSFNNLMMIYMQNPQASYVAGMKTWNSLGRKVIKGETALKILAPIQKKFKEEVKNDSKKKEMREVTKIVGFRTVPVYDDGRFPLYVPIVG